MAIVDRKSSTRRDASRSPRAHGWARLRAPLVAVVALACVCRPPAARADSTWVDHYRAARRAHAANDMPAFRAELLRVQAMLGDQPGVNYNLACAAARLGEREEALRRLRLYAASGMVRDLAADSDFVSLWADSAFVTLAARVRANGDSVGVARVHHRFSDATLLTEDVAFDPASRRFFATSVHHGRVIAVGPDGVERVLSDPGLRPGWGVFAARVDPARRLLWTSIGATPTAEGYVAADSGRTGLLAWDLRTGRVVKRFERAPDGRPHLFGDLTVGPDGTVYACDSQGGAVVVVPPGGDSLAFLVPDGGFDGPQTPALSADGRRLYVADYGRGIGIVDLAGGDRRWMAFAPGVALQGIDGLYAYGHGLIAVQNGTRPRRVMLLALDPAGERVISAVPIESGTRRLGEPTHGVVVGRRFYFLANTGWDRVGDDQRLSGNPASPPLLLEAELGPPR